MYIRNCSSIFPGATAPIGQGPLHYRGFAITLRHIALGRTPGRVTNTTQRPLADNTQHSEEKDIHALGGIRTRNPDK